MNKTLDIEAQLAIAVVFTWLFQKLKNASWFPFVDSYTENTNKIVSTVTAVIVVIGLDWYRTGSVDFSNYTGLIRDFVMQLASQHAFYKVAFTKPK